MRGPVLLCLAALLALATSAAGARQPREIAVPGSARERRAGIDADGRFFLEARAAVGDGWWRLADQSGLDPGRWRELAAANGSPKSLRSGTWYRVPPALWPPGLGERVVRGLFPDDEPHQGGWSHRVGRPRSNGQAESPWSLALLFLGEGRAHPRLGLARKTLHPGDVVTIPREVLLPHLRPRPDVAELRATTGEAVAAVEEELDEPPEPLGSGSFTVEAGTRSDDGLLEYAVDGLGPHAIYRIKAGETLYSHVVMRFTARLGGPYVNEAALRFAERSGIADVTNIPVGGEIRIPLDELRAEFLPKGHPRRVEWESGEAASRRLATITKRRGLTGVHVLLDSGHGGNDPGALSANVWEDDYAYDIKCRLMDLLAQRTHAVVHPLIQDASSGHAPLSRLKKDKDESLLTTPPLRLSEGVSTTTAVHARWLLANDIRRTLAKEGVADESMVFLSIHADSLHPSARGAMVYYPASNFRPDRYGVPSSVSASGHSFTEARTANQFKMTRTEALQSEGRSRRLGESIIEGVREGDILVHGFSPVRGYIVRRRAMVPAVLRFNRVPASVLVEAVNLNNPEDQIRLRDPSFRQAFAEAILNGLLRYFDGNETRSGQ